MKFKVLLKISNMKTINFKLYIFALSIIASLLFYDQYIGLNVFLFSMISIGLFTYINRPKINREYLVGVIPVFLSSLFIVHLCITNTIVNERYNK